MSAAEPTVYDLNVAIHDRAIQSLERDDRLLAFIEQQQQSLAAFERAIQQRDGELAELRDGLLALSNRLEAVTRAVGGGLPPVKGIQPGDLTACSACHGTGQAAPDIHAACSSCNGTGQVVAWLHSVKVTP